VAGLLLLLQGKPPLIPTTSIPLRLISRPTESRDVTSGVLLSGDLEL
jgi:hypothetical protein